MQNIKPLQTNKPRIMSNKEAMEELERYNPPKLEKPSDFKPQRMDERINEELVLYEGYKIPKQECEAITELEKLLGKKPSFVDETASYLNFMISIKNNRIVFLEIAIYHLTHIPKQINKLQKLEGLQLDYNQIQEIENLSKFINLQALNFNHNQIKEIEISNLPPNLKKLYLKDNPIKNREQVKIDLEKRGITVYS